METKKMYHLEYPDGRREKIGSHQTAEVIKKRIRLEQDFKLNSLNIKYEPGMKVVFESPSEKAPKKKTNYCGHCNEGFVSYLEENDPLYMGLRFFYACECNVKVKAMLEAEHEQNMTLPSYRQFMEQAEDRKAEYLKKIESGEIERPKPKNYTPVLRKGSEVSLKIWQTSILHAKVELAKRLYPDSERNLEFWMKFDRKHTDPIGELTKIELTKQEV